jgi:hypothetical protein
MRALKVDSFFTAVQPCREPNWGHVRPVNYSVAKDVLRPEKAHLFSLSKGGAEIRRHLA